MQRMESENKGLKPCILIADDDKDDLFLIKQAFTGLNNNVEIKTVGNGEELLNYLNRRENYKDTDAPIPKVILLDLNMPKTDGRECLLELKKDSKLKKIPVIIFSTSNNPKDIAFSYENGASGYIVKPNSFNELVEVIATFKKYWFTTVKII